MKKTFLFCLLISILLLITTPLTSALECNTIKESENIQNNRLNDIKTFKEKTKVFESSQNDSDGPHKGYLDDSRDWLWLMVGLPICSFLAAASLNKGIKLSIDSTPFIPGLDTLFGLFLMNTVTPSLLVIPLLESLDVADIDGDGY